MIEIKRGLAGRDIPVASDLSESVSMCRMAAADGCTAMVATPHLRHEQWWNEDRGRLQELIKQLKSLEQELQFSIEQRTESAKPVDLENPIGRISRMDAIQQQKMAEASKRNSELRLQQVRAALAAARQGEYGYCRECGEAIGYSRLSAKPEAMWCVTCREMLERR